MRLPGTPNQALQTPDRKGTNKASTEARSHPKDTLRRPRGLPPVHTPQHKARVFPRSSPLPHLGHSAHWLENLGGGGHACISGVNPETDTRTHGCVSSRQTGRGSKQQAVHTGSRPPTRAGLGLGRERDGGPCPGLCALSGLLRPLSSVARLRGRCGPCGPSAQGCVPGTPARAAGSGLGRGRFEAAATRTQLRGPLDAVNPARGDGHTTP